MKHVFTVHSTITFLMSYAVIKHKNIPYSDVVIISHGYKVPIQSFDVYPSFQSIRRNLISFNVPKKYDKYISKITHQQDFIAYIDLMAHYQKILVTHHNCREFHFIEEGTSTYMTEDSLEDLTFGEIRYGFRLKGIFSRNRLLSYIRIFKGSSPQLISIPYHYMAYVNFEGLQFFSMSQNAFYNAPAYKKQMVKLDSNDENIVLLAGVGKLTNALIWVDGSSSFYTRVSDSVYYGAIDAAIDKLVDVLDSVESINIKLRPKLTDFSSNYLYKALKKRGYVVNVLPDSTNLECLFAISQNCCVVGNLTAALEYAQVYNHRAISIYGLYQQTNPSFFDRLGGFWSKIEVLKP